MTKIIKSDKLTDKQKHKIKFQEALKNCDFFCAYCLEEIKKKEIPKEYFTKISLQMLFHNKCAKKVNDIRNEAKNG